MQITEFDLKDTDKTEKILSLCTKNPARELKEYVENPSAKVFVAKKEWEIVGVLCLLLTPDTADILDIAVDENYQRMGVAKKLMEFSAEFCLQKGIECQLLEVRKSNYKAIALYEKCGFEQISVRKNYYSSPVEDAVIYRREL